MSSGSIENNLKITEAKTCHDFGIKAAAVIPDHYCQKCVMTKRSRIQAKTTGKEEKCDGGLIKTGCQTTESREPFFGQKKKKKNRYL